jgi:hypothetical protein
MDTKFRELQNKLNSLTIVPEEQESNKGKMKQLQQMLIKLQQRFEEDAINNDYKLNGML